MSVEALKQQVQALTPEEWGEFFAWCGTVEHARRQAQPLVDQAQAQVVAELQDAGKLPRPDALTDPEKLPEDTSDIPAWANPHTDHSAMYRQGDIVAHKQRVWVSNHPGLNHWEPGAVGVDSRIWEDIIPQPEPEPDDMGEDEPFEGPVTAHWQAGLELKKGDTVTFEGTTYQVLKDHTSAEHWPPDQAHSLYKAE